MGSLTQVLAAGQPIPDVDVAGNLNEGLKAGINLATAKEQVESTKMKVADQKMELATKQATAMTNRTKAAMFAQSPAAFESIMKANEAYANSINVPYNAEALRAAWKDPNLRLAAQRETNRVMAGGQIQNPQAIIDFYGSDSPAIFEHLQNASYAAGVKKQGFDQQTKIEQMGNDSAERIAAMNNEAKLAKQGGAGLTMGEKARDVKFAKDFSTFFDSGGAAGIEANLESIDKSLTTLEQGKTTQAEGFVPDMVGNVMFPETANVRSNVTAVLIQGLKDTFGGQLSDGERKAMVESAYVASADPKQNAARIKALSNKIKAGARAKELAGQYFEDHGTLKGFKGTDSFNIGGKTVKFDPKGGQETSGIDINAKIKAAKDAGYSPEEIDAYIKKNASK